MEQLQDFEVEGKENNVYKLKKALYGLRQALRAWLQGLMDIFRKMASREVRVILPFTTKIRYSYSNHKFVC